MAVNLSALAGAGQQFLDANASPLTGGKLYSYQAGTTTPQTTYTTAAGNVPHANPIILDSAGRIPGGQIWLSTGLNYKFVLTSSTGASIGTWDNITGIAANALSLNYSPAATSLLNGVATDIATALDTITNDETGASVVGFIQSGANAVATTVQAKLRETVSVKDFGAVGDGIADDTAAIQVAIDYAYDNGLNVGYPATDAYYKVTRCLICRPNVSHFGIGGYAKIKNGNVNPAQDITLYRSVFLVGNFALLLTEELTQYDCGTIPAGNTVTLTNPADAAVFSVGDQVITSSDAYRTFTAGGVTYTVRDYLHLNRVEAINGAVITLRYPIDESYAGFLALPSEVTMDVTGSTGAPEFDDLPLFFCENAVFSNLDIEATRGVFPVYGAGYNVTVTNCIMRGRRAGAYSNALQYCTFTNNIGYFYDVIGEYAQNSIYTVTDNCKFVYEKHPDYTSPELRFQFNEATRNCGFTNCKVDVNEVSVIAGLSAFFFGSANNCKVSGNHIVGRNTDSKIQVCTFGGQTAGIRCTNNEFSDNLVDMYYVRLFVYFNGVDNTNIGNKACNNKFIATTGGFAYSILLSNSYDNYFCNNILTHGGFYFSDTSSSGNVITNNVSPLGFASVYEQASDVYYRQNILDNNVSDATQLKNNALSNVIQSVIAAGGSTTEVFDRSIGTGMTTRDKFKFTFFVNPVGNANTKVIEFVVRNNTTSTDSTIFSHTIPAANQFGNVSIESELFVDAPADNIICRTTVYDKNDGVTSTYLNVVVRPATNNSLSFVLKATPGASTTLNFLRFMCDFSNPYEKKTY